MGDLETRREAARATGVHFARVGTAGVLRWATCDGVRWSCAHGYAWTRTSPTTCTECRPTELRTNGNGSSPNGVRWATPAAEAFARWALEPMGYRRNGST